MHWNSTDPTASGQLDTQPTVHEESVQQGVANGDMPVTAIVVRRRHSVAPSTRKNYI